MKNFSSSKMGFFTIAVLLIWLKSYVVYLFEFNLDIQNLLQHFLLFINPISSTLVLLGIALFARGRRAGRYVLLMYTIMSVFLYSNVVYYRFNSDFITIPVLTQTSNFSSLGGSIADLMQWSDIFYGLDIVVLFFVFRAIKTSWSPKRISIKGPLIIITAGVVAFAVNLGLAELDRPQLLKRTFDRNYIVKYLGAYNFMVHDAVQNIKSSTERVLADSTDVSEVQNYTDNKYAKPDEDLFGIAKDKNVIKIHLESFQSFLIDYELDGEEVTPFLNSLVNDEEKNFTYYENFFHQTEQGKTADAELIMDNSLYGLPQGSAFVTKGKNTYQSLPAILDQEQGYNSSVFHGDHKSFWNRDEIYKEFGVNNFFDAAYYDMNDDNVIGYGLKDKPFFKESMPIMESLDEPFYAHMMSLTHHHPYLIDDEDATIDPAETGDGSVDRYFQTARYLDEALEEYFDDLKESGLYEDSVIMIYGDHYGISDNHTRALSELFDEEITPYKYAELQRVPFMLKVPGMEGKGTQSEYAGQVDVMPTLLHLLGIDSKDYITFGTDMLSDEHDDLVPFRNGDFFTEDYAMVNGVYYDNETGEEIEENDELKEMKEKVEKELSLSDKVLQGDLLRFYEPNDDWEPVDTDDYFYDDEQIDIPDDIEDKWSDDEDEDENEDNDENNSNNEAENEQE